MRNTTRTVLIDENGTAWQLLCSRTEFLEFIDEADELIFDSLLNEEVLNSNDDKRRNFSSANC